MNTLKTTFIAFIALCLNAMDLQAQKTTEVRRTCLKMHAKAC
ncbi:MAG TPA: hypothetical protein VER36_12585 [Flavisolibacter sp.]|nr:hypothetical protein [Flavisolibacter sp.]